MKKVPLTSQNAMPDDGVSSFDLADLEPGLGQVVRLLLRRGPLGRDDLLAALAALPEPARLSPAQADEAIDTLMLRRWVVACDDGQPPTYKVNLRRRSPSRTGDLWSALDL